MVSDVFGTPNDLIQPDEFTTPLHHLPTISLLPFSHNGSREGHETRVEKRSMETLAYRIQRYISRLNWAASRIALECTQLSTSVLRSYAQGNRRVPPTFMTFASVASDIRKLSATTSRGDYRL